MPKHPKITLLIIGAHSKSEGYPNVKYRIQDLLNHADIQSREVNFPFVEKFYNRSAGKLAIIWTAIRMMVAHLRVLLYFLINPKEELVYIPYPATFIACSMMILPRSKRPTSMVIDAFISIYDTVVHDRKIISKNNILARLLYQIEKKAFEAADTVIADTSHNAVFYTRLFKLDKTKVTNIPLSTNEDYPVRLETETFKELPLKILYVGTLVPLHGIDVILSAIAMSAELPVTFTLIGDGQMRPQVEKHLALYPDTLQWKDRWHSSAEVEEAIQSADICLGTFGESDKAQRVCPLKIYSYCYNGKAIITAETDWTTTTFKKMERRPVLTVNSSNTPTHLVEVIKQLVNTPELIADLQEASREFYLKELSNKSAMESLLNILEKSSTRSP